MLLYLLRGSLRYKPPRIAFEHSTYREFTAARERAAATAPKSLQLNGHAQW
jgi:hypothetical protein